MGADWPPHSAALGRGVSSVESYSETGTGTVRIRDGEAERLRDRDASASEPDVDWTWRNELELACAGVFAVAGETAAFFRSCLRTSLYTSLPRFRRSFGRLMAPALSEPLGAWRSEVDADKVWCRASACASGSPWFNVTATAGGGTSADFRIPSALSITSSDLSFCSFSFSRREFSTRRRMRALRAAFSLCLWYSCHVRWPPMARARPTSV